VGEGNSRGDIRKDEEEFQERHRRGKVPEMARMGYLQPAKRFGAPQLLRRRVDP
jgi:hypothetical protein